MQMIDARHVSSSVSTPKPTAPAVRAVDLPGVLAFVLAIMLSPFAVDIALALGLVR